MTLEDIKRAWNDNADEFNQWNELGEDEKVEFAYSIGTCFTEELKQSE